MVKKSLSNDSVSTINSLCIQNILVVILFFASVGFAFLFFSQSSEINPAEISEISRENSLDFSMTGFVSYNPVMAPNPASGDAILQPVTATIAIDSTDAQGNFVQAGIPESFDVEVYAHPPTLGVTATFDTIEFEILYETAMLNFDRIFDLPAAWVHLPGSGSSQADPANPGWSRIKIYEDTTGFPSSKLGFNQHFFTLRFRPKTGTSGQNTKIKIAVMRVKAVNPADQLGRLRNVLDETLLIPGTHESTLNIKTKFYKDGDHDTYGKNDEYFLSSQLPSLQGENGFVGRRNDCVDTDATIYPGAVELPDGKDNDCNPATGDPVAPVVPVGPGGLYKKVGNTNYFIDVRLLS